MPTVRYYGNNPLYNTIIRRTPHATITQPPYSRAALEFSSSGSTYATFATDQAFGTGDYTMGGWFLSGSDPDQKGTFIAFGSSTSAAGPQFISFGYDNNSDVTHYIFQQNSDGATSPQSLQTGPYSTIDDGNPHLVVFTRHGTTIGLYVDINQITASGDGAAGSESNASLPGGFGVGYHNFGTGGVFWYLTGILWGWAVWKGVALDGTQITAWHNQGTSGGMPPNSPTSYWPFNEGTGTTIHDVVGGFHATTHNGPAWTVHP